MKNYLEKIEDKNQALSVISGTSLSGYLHNTQYSDLIEAFGEPTFNQESGDGKIQFEWVFEFNGDIFTIYDWKTWDVEYTINELTTWNIGSKVYYGEFSDHIEEVLNSKKVQKI